MNTIKKNFEISVIIPTYNEENGIEQTIDGLKAVLEKHSSSYEIIVVNDGSSDLTAKILEKRRDILLINHSINRGYGRSLLSGIEKATHDCILMIDADGSYPPEETEKLLPYVSKFDMVIGARKGPFFWGSWNKALMRWIYLSLAKFVAGEEIPDANSGLRIFKKSVLKTSMPITCYGYSFSTTMTLSFLNSGKFVKFVPIKFTKRVGKSKVKAFRDIMRTLQIMMQIILYYNPLKFFITKSAFSLILGGFFSMLLFFKKPEYVIPVFSFFLMLSALFFIAGCIIEAIRLHNQK